MRALPVLELVVLLLDDLVRGSAAAPNRCRILEARRTHAFLMAGATRAAVPARDEPLARISRINADVAESQVLRVSPDAGR